MQPSNLPSFHFSPSLSNVLGNFEQIAGHINVIDQFQREANGEPPYVKIEACYGEDPGKLWTRVNVIAPHKTWSQGSNNLLYATVKNPLSYLSARVPTTTYDYTVLTVKTCRASIEQEVPEVFEQFKSLPHEQGDYERLIEELTDFGNIIIKVEQVAQKVITTYFGKTPTEEQSQALAAEINALHEFQSNWLSSQLQWLDEMAHPKPVEPKPSAAVVRAPVDLQFKDEETANRWFQAMLTKARQSVAKQFTLSDIQKMSKTAEDGVWPKFNAFAGELDLTFLRVARHKPSDLTDFVQGLVQRLEGRVSDEFYAMISQAETMQYLFRCLVTNGTPKDCHEVFKALCNEKMDGPCDLTRAPLFLSVILRSENLFSMFDDGSSIAKC